jgi:TATA-box binding protein (TBP) (component of TFIID and TFIIIB)
MLVGVDLNLIREAFREQGSIRIRRKGSLFSGHEWKLKETTFYNQVTIGYTDSYTTKSIKVFPNGSFQVAGCADLYDCVRVVKSLCFLLGKILNQTIEARQFQVVMINTNFALNHPVNLMEILDSLAGKGYDVSFNPDRYSAVKMKFRPKPGMKQVTASVFSTGKIIVTGAETLSEIAYAYDILNAELGKDGPATNDDTVILGAKFSEWVKILQTSSSTELLLLGTERPARLSN